MKQQDDVTAMPAAGGQVATATGRVTVAKPKFRRRKSTTPMRAFQFETQPSSEYERVRRDAETRQQQQIFLSVSVAAKELCITPRRVRALLQDGRLSGYQLPNGYWEVAFPFVVVMARRGPQLLVRRPKKPELRLV